MPLPVLSANARGAVIALCAFAVFSAHDVIIKYLGGSYSSIQIIFFSALFSFPLFTLTLIRKEKTGSLVPRHPWWTALRTASVVVTAFAGFTAFSMLPLAQTYAILFATPLLITLLSIPVLGESVGIRRGAAILVGLVGVLIVLRPGAAPMSLGHLAALVAACGSATTAIAVRKIGSDERSAVLLLYPLLANLLVMGALLPGVYRPMPIEHVGALAALSIMSLVGMTGIIAAYRDAEAVVVAPMQYSQILWAILYGGLLFGERADTLTLVGAGVVILSGVYIVIRESGARKSDNQPVLKTQTRMDTGLSPRVSTLVERYTRERDETPADPDAKG